MLPEDVVTGIQNGASPCPKGGVRSECLLSSPQIGGGLPSGLAAGIDEAGRGCLAGPVVAGAVILSAERPIEGLADSKKLTPARRKELEAVIRRDALAFGLGVVWQGRIDAINILQATFEAMAKAAASLGRRPDKLIIDGNKTVPKAVLLPLWQKAFAAPLPQQQSVVRGDSAIPAVSAASILAKTFRDRIMGHLARRWPGYGFEIHKGYGTRAHMAALRSLGLCPLHRLTFRGVLPEEGAPPPAQGSLL